MRSNVRHRSEIEAIAEEITELVVDLARAATIGDRMAATERIADLSKRLRSLCNRDLLDLQRLQDQLTNTPDHAN